MGFVPARPCTTHLSGGAMPRAQGFARGDLDTSFPLDDKFVNLRHSIGTERFYAAVGVYFHVAAATWRDGERKAGLKVCPDAPEAISDLQAVGLLDADGFVPRRAFAHTVGRARSQRRATADRVARHREGKKGVSNAYVPGANAMSVLRERGSLSHSRSPVEGGAGGDPPAAEEVVNADLWGRVMLLGEELTGIPHCLGSPYGGYGAMALAQATGTDWATFEGTWRKVAGVYGRPDVRQLVFDARDHLRPTGLAKPGPPAPPTQDEIDAAFEANRNRLREERRKKLNGEDH